jgi:hypothetical protein
MGLGDKLARFCPYTTLKRESLASENSLSKHLREKRVIIAVALAMVLAVPFVYGFYSTPQTKVVALSDLDVRVITDKNEYRANETIKASLIVYNNNSYSVQIEPIRQMYISGNSVSVLEKVNAILFLDYPAQYEYIQIDTNSSHVVHTEVFVARVPGEFMINILGAGVSVDVLG